MSQENFSIEVKLQICIEKTDFGYTASCEQLDLHAEGSSKRKAADSIKDAISLFLSTCIEMGTLHEVMTQSGFKRQIHHRRRSVECENVRVPLELLAAQANGHQTHAC